MVGRFVGCNECYGAAGTPADRVVGHWDATSRSGACRARGPVERPGGDRTTQSRSSARRTTSGLVETLRPRSAWAGGARLTKARMGRRTRGGEE